MAVLTIAFAAPAGAAGAGAASPKPAPADTFTGTITTATGRFARDCGWLTIALRPAGAGLTRRLTMRLTGRPCDGATHCIALAGTLRGQLTERPGTIPDTGRTLGLRAAGSITPLGKAGARGVVRGTGFIARGREQLTLTLSGRGGSISVTAQSGVVGGFSSP